MTRLEVLESDVQRILKALRIAEAQQAPMPRIKSLIRAHQRACQARNAERAAVMASQADFAWSGGIGQPETEIVEPRGL